MAVLAPEAIRDEILDIAPVGLDRHEFARAGTRVLRRTVPFDGVAVVWFDPATGLPVDTWIDNSRADGAGSRPRDIELHETDVNKFRQLAASGRLAASNGNELRAVCLSESGMWAGIVMYREPGAPDFAARDVGLLASLALSGGVEEVQRVRLERDLSIDTGDRDPGLLVLDDEDGIEMVDAAAAAWLDEMPDNGRRLPLVVTAVAQHARAIASGQSDGAATARVRAASGRWVLVRGSVLRNGTSARTAVSFQPARASELGELIADAYGLTARERCVTRLVARGLSTAAIAARLHLSTYTVQDHLKAIFEKLDVSSRGQLVAMLFVDHHQVGGRLSDLRRSPPARERERSPLGHR